MYTFLGSLPKIQVIMNYVSWFCVLYFIASYIRFYGCFNIKRKYWKLITSASVILSVLSVCVFLWLDREWEINVYPYRLVSDSNAFFALLTGVCSFMYFKDLPIKNNRIINLISQSAFGVLLIHANSDIMRQWLWKDALDNVGCFISNPSNALLHLIICVIGIYIACTIIDYLRIAYIERPTFRFIDKIIQKYHFE